MSSSKITHFIGKIRKIVDKDAEGWYLVISD